ncbi:MAG: LVIVD repeat-containing protein [Promethearchaeota archaeon]
MNYVLFQEIQVKDGIAFDKRESFLNLKLNNDVLFSYPITGVGSIADIKGDYVYFALVNDRFEIYNITDKSSAYSMYNSTIPNMARWVSVSNNYAYIADYTNGLRIYNITDINNPQYITTFSCNSHDVKVIGDLAYIADESYGLRILNVSDPSHPVQIGADTTFNNIWRLKVSGNYVYSTDHYVGRLKITDISDPKNPLSLGYVTLNGRARWVAVYENFVYVNDQAGYVNIIDVSNPNNPKINKSIYIGDEYNDVWVFEKYLFIMEMGTSNYNNLTMYDISIPYNPKYLSYIMAEDCITDVKLTNDYLYVFSWYGMEIFARPEDKLPPSIIINSPQLNRVFGSISPDFNVEIHDTNLDTMWYTIDGVSNKQIYFRCKWYNRSSCLDDSSRWTRNHNFFCQ